MGKDKVEHFEDLRVYQAARQLAKTICGLTQCKPFCRDFSLTDQIRRAAVSIVSNIAEGFERGSNTERIQFLYIAKGSAGEVRAQLGIAHDLGYLSEQDQKSSVEQCRTVSRMLAAYIEYHKRGKYPGQKFKQPPRKSYGEEVNEVLERIQQEMKEKGIEIDLAPKLQPPTPEP